MYSASAADKATLSPTHSAGSVASRNNEALLSFLLPARDFGQLSPRASVGAPTGPPPAAVARRLFLLLTRPRRGSGWGKDGAMIEPLLPVYTHVSKQRAPAKPRALGAADALPVGHRAKQSTAVSACPAVASCPAFANTRFADAPVVTGCAQFQRPASTLRSACAYP